MKHLLIIAILVILGGTVPASRAQSESTAVFEGCAMPLEENHNFLTLCEPHSCSLLRGNVDLKWAGHNVKIRGILHQPTSNQPRTIQVEAAVEVGKACSKSCQPSIPGRGLNSKDKPDKEGATPGFAPKDTKPPGAQEKVP